MRQNACRNIRQRFHFFFCRKIESSPEFHVQRFKFAHAEIVIFQEFIILQILEIRYKTANIGLPDKMGIPAGQIQVLTPTRKGETGTVSLNRALQAALNPPAPGKRQKTWGDMIFRVGDRVMQTRNNYDVLWEKDNGEAGSGIFNGDVGTVEDIDPSGELVTIRFDDRTSVYTADLLSQLDMAYAMTVHKAQGSEYRAVVLVSAPAAPNLLVRGVLYTAITRARELLVMVGDDAIPGRMAENDRRTRRYSGLRRRLKQGGPSHGHE